MINVTGISIQPGAAIYSGGKLLGYVTEIMVHEDKYGHKSFDFNLDKEPPLFTISSQLLGAWPNNLEVAEPGRIEYVRDEQLIKDLKARRDLGLDHHEDEGDVPLECPQMMGLDAQLRAGGIDEDFPVTKPVEKYEPVTMKTLMGSMDEFSKQLEKDQADIVDAFRYSGLGIPEFRPYYVGTYHAGGTLTPEILENAARVGREQGMCAQPESVSPKHFTMMTSRNVDKTHVMKMADKVQERIDMMRNEDGYELHIDGLHHQEKDGDTQTWVDCVGKGSAKISERSYSRKIDFAVSLPDANYSMSVEIVNDKDDNPMFLVPIISHRGRDGFTVDLSEAVDSPNYRLDWKVILKQPVTSEVQLNSIPDPNGPPDARIPVSPFSLNAVFGGGGTVKQDNCPKCGYANANFYSCGSKLERIECPMCGHESDEQD